MLCFFGGGRDAFPLLRKSDSKLSMNGPSTSPSPPAASPAVRTDWSSLSAVLYLWIPACLLAFLLGVVPYGMGYGFEKVPLAYLMEELWKLPDWEHCFLVPLAVAFIIYEMRDKLAVLRPQPSAWGYPMVIVGLLFFWAGERVDNQYIGYASVQWLIGSWIVLTLGWGFFRQLAFPWMFLVFLWPLLFLETYLAFPLRMIMSEASVTALNVIGIPAVKSGTSILSAADPETGKAVGQAFSVDVADPCSGIRSLFALMMVSALYGFFVFKEWWKHAVIFLCSIPLAVAGNLFRILLLTVGTLMFGSEFAIGGGLEDPSTFHMVAGFFVFAVALGGMLGIGWLFNTDLRAFFRARQAVFEARRAAATGATDVASGGDTAESPSQTRSEDLY